MARYNDPKTGKTVEARNATEAKELLKEDGPVESKVSIGPKVPPKVGKDK